jgi:4-amino-4-deoxy-L-arabinose transferase-like glycosyltransferase
MQSFYQPHVREPVFLAITHGALRALGDQDAGVSLASAIGSVAAIFATYLLAAQLISPWAGVAAALLMAIEYEQITWAVDGWRDDTFTAVSLFAAWALLRLYRRPSFSSAVLAGIIAGLACLTRITAASYILPALAWLTLADRAPIAPRRRWELAAVTAVVAAVLVTPYLISCAIGSGDPLLALNYHTGYYRFAEGLPSEQPMSAADYIVSKFGRRPLGTLDTGVTGLLVEPFIRKWNGFAHWSPMLGPTLAASAVAGLVLLAFSPPGRLFLVILLTSLLPYAFTWNLGGGGEWRFTMHAYPFYMVAAAYFLAMVVRGLTTLLHNRSLPSWTVVAPVVRRGLAVAAIALAAGAAYVAMPWLVVREAIAAGDSTSVPAGGRDQVFYGDGWSAPHRDSITVRVSLGERATIRIPLPAKRNYDLVLRMDPVQETAGQRVTVLLNRQLVGRPALTWDPQRVGSYRVLLGERAVRAGINELTLIPESLTSARDAGPRFEWLEPDARIGIRLWYVRVLP